MDSGVREHPDIVKKYFGTVIPANDNKFAALNSAVWSGGSFIYVPPGVECEMPLQAYFRINSENAGQFERTLIIADEGAKVHYIEGCSAPVYTNDSLHSAVVEIVVKPSARVTYTTIQNWSPNVYNLVTKRARAEAEGLADRVRFELMDYRALDRQFDRIVSVGMFEHVGQALMPTYFAKLRRLLRPGGLLMNHGITAGGTRVGVSVALGCHSPVRSRSRTAA